MPQEDNNSSGSANNASNQQDGHSALPASEEATASSNNSQQEHAPRAAANASSDKNTHDRVSIAHNVLNSSYETFIKSSQIDISPFISLAHEDQCTNIQLIYKAFQAHNEQYDKNTSGAVLKQFFAYWKGMEALYERKFEIAIGFFTTCIGLQPPGAPLSMLYRVRGIAFLGNQRIQRALGDFKKCIALNQQQACDKACHDVCFFFQIF